MSELDTSYMSLALQGNVLPDEIDDFVDIWHENDDKKELHEFLGMRLDEYTLWVSNPDAIELILAARHNSVPLMKAVNDNIKEVERIAARSDKSWKIAQLRSWVEQQRKRHS